MPLTATTTITATFGGSAATTLATKTVVWTRDADGAWKCTTNVDTKFRNASCASSS